MKWADRHIIKEDKDASSKRIRNDKKHMKRCVPRLAMGECKQNRDEIPHALSERLKKTVATLIAGQDAGRRELLLVWLQLWRYRPLENSSAVCFKAKCTSPTDLCGKVDGSSFQGH